MSSKEVRIPLSVLDSILFQLSQKPDIERSKAQLLKIHKLILQIFKIVKRVNKNDIREIRFLKKQMCEIYYTLFAIYQNNFLIFVQNIINKVNFYFELSLEIR